VNGPAGSSGNSLNGRPALYFQGVDGYDTVDLCVITVTYNSARHLPSFLAALPAAADGVRMRVVVVDNGSQDGSAEVARQAGVIVVETEVNLGYSGGINAGRRHADGCKAVVIANPDLRFEAGSLSILYAAVLRSGGVAVPLLLGPDGAVRSSMFREPTVSRQLGEALLGDRWYRRPHWLSEVVRDPDAYRSTRPVEWATAWRVRQAGFPIEFVPQARAVHEERGSGRATSLLPLAGMNKLRYYRARHSRTASAAYAMAVLLQMLARAHDPEHRRATRVLARAVWPAVVRGEFADLAPPRAPAPVRR
jgi:N-acetylglucosaminyl-diphospho-decaprenol L-rhamnosyltransferase